METFNFPFHTVQTDYPESGTRVQLNGNYLFTAPPQGPDLRVFNLKFETMFYFETGPVGGSYMDENAFVESSIADPYTNVMNPVRVVTDATYGHSVYERTGPSGTQNIAHRWGFLRDPTRTYQIETDLEITNIGASAGATPRLRYTTVSGTYTSAVSTNVAVTQGAALTGSGAVTLIGRIGPDSKSGIVRANMPDDGSVYVRPLAQFVGLAVDTTWRVKKIQITDVTGQTDGVQNIHIDRSKKPEINMAVLEAFYNRHKLHKSFVYPHPIYGNVECKFGKPLRVPHGKKQGLGSVEDFTLEFIEVQN